MGLFEKMHGATINFLKTVKWERGAGKEEGMMNRGVFCECSKHEKLAVYHAFAL